MKDLEAEISDRIRSAIAAGKRIEGLLFHGTAEPIVGALKPGGDGLLWTSDSPVIAQQYIPAAGIEIIRSKPMSYEMDMRVPPNTNDVFYQLAADMTGLEITDVERDAIGQAVSWRVPKGWPTYADVVRHVEETLGYRASTYGSYSLKSNFKGGRDRIMPASWQMQGQLFVTLADGLEFKDIRQSGEPDLTIKEHNEFDAFRKARGQGFDGVIINDFAQTDAYGNFGHLSWGLNPKGLAKVTWIAMPAVRFDLKEAFPFPVTTPDLDAWMEAREAAVVPGI